MSNFFNAIGVADMEKVHSAVIGWLLSDKCNAFDITQKSKILCGLFNVGPSQFDKIDVNVEVYDIDILVTTKRNSLEECWIIENKIKSNQHDNQLDKYVRIINGIEETSGKNPKPITEKYRHIPDGNQHYCFLTLIKETPIGKYASKWINKRYDDLVQLLSPPLLFPLSICSNADGVIFQQYVSCITNMTNALKDFLINPNNYPHVFTDGSKKKTEKEFSMIVNDHGRYALYIAENGMETIFQKCYLGETWNRYRNTSHIYSKKPCNIDESNGKAMLDIILPDIMDNNNNIYHTQIEFQDGSFKVQIHQVDDNWKNQTEADKQTQKDVFLGIWEVFFKTVKNTMGKEWTKNSPDKNSLRPYLSLSKKVTDWLKDPNTLLELWKDHFEECEKVMKELIQESGCKYY